MLDKKLLMYMLGPEYHLHNFFFFLFLPLISLSLQEKEILFETQTDIYVLNFFKMSKLE